MLESLYPSDDFTCFVSLRLNGPAGRVGLLLTALPDWADLPPNDNFYILTWLKVAQLGG